MQRCQQAGATRIIIAPFFLVAGKFVRTDLPARLEPIITAHPQLQIKLARAIENTPAMLPLIQDLLTETREPRQWQFDAIAQARQQCELRETCPIYGSEMCRAQGKTPQNGIQSKWRRSVTALEIESPVLNPVPNPIAENKPITNQPRRGLLFILHGSPHPEANSPALSIARQIQAQQTWDDVAVAYLDCNQPDIHTALDQAGDAGLTRLDVLPYFLHPGRHLIVDIGNALQAARKRWPEMEIHITPAVGESPQLPAVLLHRINET